MATRRARAVLPSDTEFLLGYFDALPDRPESDDEFEGYLGPDNGPLACPSAVSPLPELQRSQSVDSLTEMDDINASEETPFPPVNGSPSPSPSLLQGNVVGVSQASPRALDQPSPMQHSPRSDRQPPAFLGSPGIVPDMSESSEPIDFFSLMFNKEVKELILRETNRYAAQYLESEREYLERHPHARAHDWKRAPLSMKELEVFLALLLTMGTCGFPVMRLHWSTSWPFSNDNFNLLMSIRRFELVLRFLHLNDSSVQPQRGQEGYDKLYKLRPFLDLLICNFQDAYTPSQFLSIDESIIGFKGRLAFLQYLPKKPHKWGIKAWVLADSSNAYTWGWRLYTGKDEERQADRGLAHDVVVKLVEDVRLDRKGYVIVMNNFYSSPAFYEDLVERGFGAVGTVRPGRRGIPTIIREAKLKKGEMVSIVVGGLLFLKWWDKRAVNMLSTYHDNTMVTKSRRSRGAERGTEEIQKPRVVEDYNQLMGGVDQSDQLLMYYGFSHRSTKWWKRVFFHMLDLSVVNSHILYRKYTSTNMSLLDFRVSIARSLTDGLVTPRYHHLSSVDPALPLRLYERAFPEPVPNKSRPDCRVCSRRAKGKRCQTGYRCKSCKTPLCQYPCFEIYHTITNYKAYYIAHYS